MKILLIRTDKLGDLYVALPFINALKRNFGRDNIDILVSENIFDHFKKKHHIFGKIFSFPKNKFIQKILLIFKLRKYNYENIIVFDGKDRSLILAFFLKSLKKTIMIEKRKLNFIFNFFITNKKKYSLIFDDRVESYHSLYSRLIGQLKIDDSDYKFLEYKNLKSLNLPKNIFDSINPYSLIHIDEKWFSDLYIKDYTDIDPTPLDFIEFIKEIIIKNNKNIIITTGLIKLPFLDKLKDSYFKKIDDNIYEFKFKNSKTFIFLNSTIEDLEIFSMNSQNLITCNCPLSQIAVSYNINLIDIIERKLEPWYLRHIHQIKNYNKLHRKNFKQLSGEILSKIN